MASGETSEKDLGPITELINSTKNLQSNRLDLSRQTLVTLPDVLLGLTKLEQLYLDGNLLTELPGTFFESLTSLKWLDLRNNKLRAIPSSIGQHRALRSLLLDRNELQKLPIELGMVKSITGIHLADNPLEFPPKDVVEKGTQEILKFLRSHIPGEEAPQGAESTEEEQPKVQLPKARQVNQNEVSNNREKGHSYSSGPGYLRKQSVESKMKEELQTIRRKISNERADKIIQKRKDKQTREEWHAEAKRMQRHKEQLTRIGMLDYQSPEPPFGTQNQKEIPGISEHARQVKEALEAVDRKHLTSPDDIMASIQKHIADMEERRFMENQLPVEDDVELARRNLEKALRLHKKLDERRALEYRLRAFTGEDIFPSKHSTAGSRPSLK